MNKSFCLSILLTLKLILFNDVKASNLKEAIDPSLNQNQRNLPNLSVNTPTQNHKDVVDSNNTQAIALSSTQGQKRSCDNNHDNKIVDQDEPYYLPQELWCMTFDYLNPKTLKTLKLVSKQFNTNVKLLYQNQPKRTLHIKNKYPIQNYRSLTEVYPNISFFEPLNNEDFNRLSFLTNLQNLSFYVFGRDEHYHSTSLGSLTNLTRLKFGKPFLITSFLSSNVSTLTNLVYLNLSCNQLTDIPPTFSALTNLTTLDLHNNQLTGLPFIISDLTNLTTLDLRIN